MISNKIKYFFINDTILEIYTIVVARFMTLLVDSFFNNIFMPILYKNKKTQYYHCRLMGANINLGLFIENLFKFIIVLLMLSYFKSQLQKK